MNQITHALLSANVPNASDEAPQYNDYSSCKGDKDLECGDLSPLLRLADSSARRRQLSGAKNVHTHFGSTATSRLGKAVTKSPHSKYQTIQSLSTACAAVKLPASVLRRRKTTTHVFSAEFAEAARLNKLPRGDYSPAPNRLPPANAARDGKISRPADLTKPSKI